MTQVPGGLPGGKQTATVREEQRCEEAGENPARSRHCNRAMTPESQIFRRCWAQPCQGRVIPKELR